MRNARERQVGWGVGLMLTTAVFPAPARAAGIEAWAEPIARRAMATGSTPGMAIAVVRGDRIVWQAGFGDADRERHAAVVPTTRFYIASTSKALTALAAARLAARGALDLDAPLSRALPGAVFAEGVHGDSIRVRDLLTHTHGIDPAGPISLRVAFTGEYTNDELLHLLRAHAAAKAGRAFAYSNLGYDLAGIVLSPDALGGWKEVVRREVTAPLRMTSTTAWRSRVPEARLAQPYEMGPQGFERIRLAKEDANIGPAGGHFSTAGDLARLVIAELNEGWIDGRPVIEADAIRESQRMQASQDRDFGGIHRHGWGLGWDLGVFDGDTLVHRFGSFAGYRSHVSFMPGHDCGVVVLTNGGGASSALADRVAFAIYDRLLGRADADGRLDSSLVALRELRDKGLDRIRADREKRAARQQPLPLPLPAYAGTFSNPLYGTLTMRVVDGRLEAAMGVARSRVEVYDAGANALRLELFGGGDVAKAILSEDGRAVAALELLEVRFDRR